MSATDVALQPLDKYGKAIDEVEEAAEPILLRVYKRRWIVLIAVALLNNTNTMSWISYAPSGNYVNSFYGDGSAAWLSVIYMLCTIPVGVFAMWAGGEWGLRTAVLIAGWANGIGAVIRVISSLDFMPQEYRFATCLTGQAIAAVAYPFIMFLPTKVAGSWFPDTQRAIATTVGVMSNPLGVLMANLISPRIVQAPEHVIWLNVFTCVPSLVAMALATFGVNRSVPKIPPTISASKPQMDFVSGMKSCFSSKQYIILLIVMGGGIGMFNCLYTVMMELLCPSGYSNTFSGICAALMIIGGVFGAAASGIFVDRTKLYEQTLKLSLTVAVAFGVIFLQLTLHQGQSVLIAIMCLLFGVLGLASYPVGLELASECTFPVSEATSTGLIVLSGQIQSVIYVFIMKKFARALQPEFMSVQVCQLTPDDTTNIPKDNSMSILIFSALAGLLVLVLLAFFKPVYKRLEAERGNRATADKAKELAKEDHVTLQTDSVVQPLQSE
uniref:MFS domain-containing protein n=1 Tax=Caenorhabditis japonica TaxID=281687 RepID=A0A8R1I4A6_CAEJA